MNPTTIVASKNVILNEVKDLPLPSQQQILRVAQDDTLMG
jgi:transcriptional regulator with AAA-type ATPase domain